MALLHLCVSMGVEVCAKGVPILAEELQRNSAEQKARRDPSADYPLLLLWLLLFHFLQPLFYKSHLLLPG